MRHLRLSNQNSNSLSQFKKQISSILKRINNFDEADRTEAINYVQKFIDDHTRLPKHNPESEAVDIHHNINEKMIAVVPSRRMKVPVKIRRKSVIKKTHKICSKLKAKPFLKCKVCSETKKTKMSLLKHMELHVGTPMSCAVCRRSFNSRISFDWHLMHLCKRKKILLNKRYKCPECPQKFSLQRYLNLHIEGHRRNNCSYCDTVLTRREHLVQHMLDVHKIKLERSMFSCEYCEKRFVKRQSLYYHLRQHLPNKHVCMECGEISDSSEEHNVHTKKHDEQKPWECNRCKDKFSRRQQYIYHLKRHDRYKCVTCKENYASKAHAYAHLKRGHLVHGLEPQLHCPHCPAAFHRTLLLQIHIRKHKEETTTINCKFCDKTFHTPYQYYKHCKTTMHDKNSPQISQLVCENCGKQFTKKYMLEQHLQRFHGTNRSTFSCKYCDYQTQFKPNLERHVNLHFSDKKQYICDHCGKAFSNIGGLTDHIDYIHIQEKQFKCSECNKSFKRNSELVRHQSCHSDARPHACNLCRQAYKRINHLRRHEETAHGIVTKSKKVQRLKTDSTGAVVPVPTECKKSAKDKKNATKLQVIDPVYSLATEEVGNYFGPTVSVINSVALPKTMGSSIITLDASEFNQQEFWGDKLNLQGTNANTVALPQMNSMTAHASDLQAFNMVDQLVKSLLPSKELQMNDCQVFNEYASNATALEYDNMTITAMNKENGILAKTDRIGMNNVAW